MLKMAETRATSRRVPGEVDFSRCQVQADFLCRKYTAIVIDEAGSQRFQVTSAVA